MLSIKNRIRLSLLQLAKPSTKCLNGDNDLYLFMRVYVLFAKRQVIEVHIHISLVIESTAEMEHTRPASQSLITQH